MPDKEGAEEKTTKSVVNKKQKQMMGEEGYDVARDMGRVRPSKDKKDATSYPPSDEVKKTQKVNKGPSALERVKADIEKRYGKGAIMDVKKEELDLTKVAEAFGGHIVKEQTKKNKPKIEFGTFKYNKKAADAKAAADALSDIKGDKEIMGKPTPEVKKAASKQIKKFTAPKPGDIEAEKRILDARLNKKAAGDVGADALLDKIKEKPKVRSAGRRTPSEKLADIKKGIDIKEPTFKSPVTGKKMPIKLGRNLKNIGATSTKSVQTALKQGAKTTARTALKKGAVKGTGKLLAKRIPGIGAAISGAETFGRAASGDYVGAAISGAETIANLIPGVQQTLGTGLAGIGMARDIRKASQVTNAAKKTIQTAKAARGKKGFSAFMKPAKEIKKKYAKMPSGATELGKKIRGKTKLGRGLRAVAFGQEFLPGGGVGGRIIKGFTGAAKKSVDGSHVGRRTAG